MVRQLVHSLLWRISAQGYLSVQIGSKIFRSDVYTAGIPRIRKV